MLPSQPSLGDASFSSFNTTSIVRADGFQQKNLEHDLESPNQRKRDLNYILKDRDDLEG